jgi:hypothetical protein
MVRPIQFALGSQRYRDSARCRQTQRASRRTSTELQMSDLVSRAAVALWEASRSGVACAPVRTVIGKSDTDTAYAVQEHITNSDNSGLSNSNSAANIFANEEGVFCRT